MGRVIEAGRSFLDWFSELSWPGKIAVATMITIVFVGSLFTVPMIIGTLLILDWIFGDDE